MKYFIETKENKFEFNGPFELMVADAVLDSPFTFGEQEKVDLARAIDTCRPDLVYAVNYLFENNFLYTGKSFYKEEYEDYLKRAYVAMASDDMGDDLSIHTVIDYVAAQVDDSYDLTFADYEHFKTDCITSPYAKVVDVNALIDFVLVRKGENENE